MAPSSSPPSSTRSSSPPASTFGAARLSTDKRRVDATLIELPPVDPSAVSSSLVSLSSYLSPPRLVGRSLFPSGVSAAPHPAVTLFDDDFSDSDESLAVDASPVANSRLRRCPGACSPCLAGYTYTARTLTEVVLPPVTTSSASGRFVLCTFLYSFLHGATDQLLPAAYKALEAQLNFSPTVLGGASSLARLAHAFSCPLWGLAVDALSGSRRLPASSADRESSRNGEVLILRVSCIGWGVCTLLLALLTHEWQLMPFMLVSGVLMAVLGPISQKILGEMVASDKRGTAFGNMSFFQSTGRMLALMLTTGLSAAAFAGVAGWRLAFALVGCLSIVFGAALSWMLPSSNLCSPKALCGERTGDESWTGKARKHAATLLSLGYVFRTRSFGVMLLLGVLNGMPRSALNFIVMFFQYCGLADWQASFTVSASWLAAMFVAPFVGRLGDSVHRLYPNKGRPVLAQLAILTRALLMFLVLACVPKRGSSFPLFLALSTLIGFMAGWPGVGVNRPILTEIVLPRHRATVFSLFSTMESVGSALLGAPVVGMLAQQAFGYTKPLTKRGSSSSSSSVSSSSPSPSSFVSEGAVSDSGVGGESASRSEEELNAEALGQALVCTTVGPWLASVVVYFLLHWTYTADRAAASRRREAEEREAERDAAQRERDTAVELGCMDTRESDAEDADFTKWSVQAKKTGMLREGYTVVATREETGEGDEGRNWDADEGTEEEEIVRRERRE
ncbi:putative membrane transporter PFB0275w [Neospora caninum Liverpool]|uniref:Membrane transporter PFB0275w, putative n=1 Tax=Neospora caninum (strain Liverpool) TaxID=572307 RepID=F0VQS5_NEOCL|nr:putative membrane transporter PFB0275w [Neospora caninum Liverpool]CBZ56072.1 putative membrane transporter PFB0275w [Neospora caninum Liverpool]CEL70820.1 TPA: membrane transporter PFB0275w, putative [Neospora caninum Liverpool]|eukprot:XP_003886098.1 putative membrane transporter PFB0275w [Neospora caninum Liverpool]